MAETADGAGRIEGDARRGADRRSPLFRVVGHGLGLWLVALFVFMTAKTIYQSDNWKESYFRDVTRVGDDCNVRVAGAMSLADAWTRLQPLAFEPLALPHTRGALSGLVTGTHPFYAAEYQCRVRLHDRAITAGSTYLHTGWIYGDRIEVAVNGELRFEGTTQDKPAVPLLMRDLDAPEIVFTIRAVTDNLRRLGLAGAQPMALASGTAENFALFGLETALDLTLDLQKLMPLLTLGIVLVFAWSIGIRTRLILAGFFYLALSATEQVLTLSKDLWSVDALKIYVIGVPLAYGGSFAVLLLAMEVLGLWKRSIYPLMVSVAILAVGTTVVLALYPGVPSYHINVVQALKTVMVVCALLVAVRGVRIVRKMAPDPGRRVAAMMTVITGLFAVVYGAELAARQLGTALYFGSYIQLVLPLFLAGALIYSQKVEGDQLGVERRRSKALEAQVALGRGVQDLFVPTVRKITQPSYSCEIFHVPSDGMDGEWFVHWRDPRGRLHLCMGDVAGDGARAAVAVSAIMAAIQVCRIEDRPMDICISRINAVLAEQFSRFVTTTLSAVTIGADGDVELYGYGGLGFGLITDDEARHLTVAGSVLGAGDILAHGRRTLRLAPGSALVVFAEGALRTAHDVQTFLEEARAALRAGGAPVQSSMAVVRAA